MAGTYSRQLALPLLVLLVLQWVMSLSGATPVSKTRCTKPIIRKEWRTLKRWEQIEYLAAVRCFMAKPGITPKADAPAAFSRYDDLVATHITQAPSIHYVGHFLPWHRWFTVLYEQGLRDECGYSGAQPYWDWTLDVTPSSKFVDSPVFDPVFGFGGNGAFVASNDSHVVDVSDRTGGGCVQDGPFRDLVVSLGPLDDVSGNPRCLKRCLVPDFASRYLSMNQTALTLDQPDFGWFARVLMSDPSSDVFGIHDGGHYGVGGPYGQMCDVYASPTDPIFFMHHTNLDRVWWSWQMRDPQNRLEDISGPIYKSDYTNSRGANVTLDFEMTMGVNANNISVMDTMNIVGDTFCFNYDQLY